MMEYKGYHGALEIDEENSLLHGAVLGLRDVVTFQGRTVDEARKAFEESVEDYLEFCRERGEEPEKPFSGKFRLGAEPQTGVWGSPSRSDSLGPWNRRPSSGLGSGDTRVDAPLHPPGVRPG
ncbi:MAG: type II toxin-antitoxin system HicB family antitoxin [Dehalococcoidia bacterium]